MQDNTIPPENSVYATLKHIAQTARGVVFSGLPGVGKSLYINQLNKIAQTAGRLVTPIQWDMARKAFETPHILKRFPMGEGTVHNGIKLCAGMWIIDTLKTWLAHHEDRKNLLLIEAPLVGHRFVELAQKQSDNTVEAFLASNDVQFIVPIPSQQVRDTIVDRRAAQVPDEAQTWIGAKPAVMTMIWNEVYAIAGNMGYAHPQQENMPYNPDMYEFVFRHVLKNRNMTPLRIDQVFSVTTKKEEELHNLDSLIANRETAEQCFEQIIHRFPDDHRINRITSDWYKIA